MPRGAAIVLEGGFDNHTRFFFIPLGANEALSEIWRRSVVALFLSKGLLNPDFAGKLLSWRHSGFSIESGTRIYDQESRQALSQYIVRPPLSLEKIHWDEQQDTVTWKSCPSGYFKGREKHFSPLDFIAQLTLHIPRAAVTQLRQERKACREPRPGAATWCVDMACIPPQAGSAVAPSDMPVAQQTAGGSRTGHLERPPRTPCSRTSALVWPTGR
jgi:hypothetical protein